MAGEKIWLFDTTLRDGGQTRGVDFSHADKTLLEYDFGSRKLRRRGASTYKEGTGIQIT